MSRWDGRGKRGSDRGNLALECFLYRLERCKSCGRCARMCNHDDGSTGWQIAAPPQPKPADKHKFRRQFAPEIRADVSPNLESLRAPATPTSGRLSPRLERGVRRTLDETPECASPATHSAPLSPRSPQALCPPARRQAWARAVTEDGLSSPSSSTTPLPIRSSPASPHSRSAQGKLAPLKGRALSVDSRFSSNFVRTPSSDGDSKDECLLLPAARKSWSFCFRCDDDPDLTYPYACNMLVSCAGRRDVHLTRRAQEG